MMERDDPELARFRRLEAQIGCDPDEVDEQVMRCHLEDAAVLGEDAMGEVAAGAAIHGSDPDDMMSAETIANVEKRSGFDTDLRDGLMLHEATCLPRMGEMEA